jgi:hypothetical protein
MPLILNGNSLIKRDNGDLASSLDCCCSPPGCPEDKICGEECCGENETCCNDVCCGENEHCVDGECEPCPEGWVLCGQECCPEGKCCNGVCCNEINFTCCDGVCCDLSGCDWGDNRIEVASASYDTSPCSPGVVGVAVQQTIFDPFRGETLFSNGLPAGNTWKANAEDALAGCRWAIVVNQLFAGCHVLEDDFNYCSGNADSRVQWKILKADCDGNVTDVTADLVDGPMYIDREFTGLPGLTGPCTTPAEPPFGTFYDDPEFICPP